VSISSAVLETQQRSGTFNVNTANSTENIYDVYNYGAFAASAVFGFLCTILYIGHFISQLLDLINERKSSSY
jgi:hypothetical protein